MTAITPHYFQETRFFLQSNPICDMISQRGDCHAITDQAKNILLDRQL